METDYVLFASCNDQISSLLVKEAQKDIDKFGACGLWSGKSKYLNEDIFDKYYLPMIASHKSLKVKNPYDYFCKMEESLKEVQLLMWRLLENII